MEKFLQNLFPPPENLIKKAFHVSLILVVYAAENHAPVRKKLPCQYKPRIKHGKKIVSCYGVVVIRLCKLAHAVFSVGRININHIDFASVLNQKVLQSLIVVADNQFGNVDWITSDKSRYKRYFNRQILRK